MARFGWLKWISQKCMEGIPSSLGRQGRKALLWWKGKPVLVFVRTYHGVFTCDVYKAKCLPGSTVEILVSPESEVARKEPVAEALVTQKLTLDVGWTEATQPRAFRPS